MNVDSSFWESAQWIDFESGQNVKWSHVEYFVEKYKGILQYDDYEIIQYKLKVSGPSTIKVFWFTSYCNGFYDVAILFNIDCSLFWQRHFDLEWSFNALLFAPVHEPGGDLTCSWPTPSYQFLPDHSRTTNLMTILKIFLILSTLSVLALKSMANILVSDLINSFLSPSTPIVSACRFSVRFFMKVKAPSVESPSPFLLIVFYLVRFQFLEIKIES